MGNAIIAAAGGRTRVDITPPESATQSSATGQVLRNGAQSIDAMTEYGASGIAAPRIRMLRKSTGEEHFEISIPGRGMLEGKDAEAILKFFWLTRTKGHFGRVAGRRQNGVDIANQYMSLAIPPEGLALRLQ
jgi:hypothetical protein